MLQGLEEICYISAKAEIKFIFSGGDKWILQRPFCTNNQRGNHLLSLLTVYKMICLLVPNECGIYWVPINFMAKYTYLCFKTCFISFKMAILKNSGAVSSSAIAGCYSCSGFFFGLCFVWFGRGREGEWDLLLVLAFFRTYDSADCSDPFSFRSKCLNVATLYMVGFFPPSLSLI